MIYSLLRKIRCLLIKTFIPIKGAVNSISIIDGPIHCFNPNVTVGRHVSLYPNVSFFGDGPIIIGDDVKIGNNCVIYASKDAGVTIGSKTIIAANSYIIDNNHNIALGIPIQSQGLVSKHISIGSDVWIGASCVIGMGADIRMGAVIGANSFVNSEILENQIAFGSPARCHKKRI